VALLVEMSSVCRCRSSSKERIETKADDAGDEMEAVKSEKKVRTKTQERKPAAASAVADTGVSGETGEKRRRSRRLSIKEETKDLDDDGKLSASMKDASAAVTSDNEGVVKEFLVKEERERDEPKPVKDEVVYLCCCIQSVELISSS